MSDYVVEPTDKIRELWKVWALAHLWDCPEFFETCQIDDASFLAWALTIEEGMVDPAPGVAGPSFCSRFGNPGCYILDSGSYMGPDITYYEPGHVMGEMRGDVEIPALKECYEAGDHEALALALICRERLK